MASSGQDILEGERPMKIRVLAALLGAAGLCGLARAADPPKTAPSAQRSPIPVAAAAKIVRGATFTVPNVAGVPGEKVLLKAVLREDSPGNPPLVGKTPSFKVSGNGMAPVDPKASETDAQGQTTASLKIPDVAQGSYDVQAAWKGDAEHKPAVGSGKLTVIKAPTKIDMDFVYGTYKNEPGKYASFSAKVVRAHDGQILKKPITLTVNGSTRVMPASEYHNTALPDANTWVVKVQFEGDAAYAASAAEKTYHKPKS
jgi:hypothetical protein